MTLGEAFAELEDQRIRRYSGCVPLLWSPFMLML